MGFADRLSSEIRGVTSVLGQAARERYAQEQAMRNAIQMELLKANIANMNRPWEPRNMAEAVDYYNQTKGVPEEPSPLDNLLKVSKVATALSELGVNPRLVLGQDLPITEPRGVQGKHVIDVTPGGGETSSAGAGVGLVGPLSFRGGQPRGSDIVATSFKPTPFGGLRPTAYKDLGVERKKAKIKEGIKIEAGKRQAQVSLDVVSGAAKRLAERYSKAVGEGGIGDIAKSWASTGALKVGGRFGERFPNTAAYEGQKTEFITKMMPILTQQADKAGSVRLVSTVFDRLMATLPDKNHPPIVAREMLRATVENMFGFSAAIKRLGITNEQVESLSAQELAMLGDQIEAEASRAGFTPKERAELDTILGDVLAPLDKLINVRGGAPSAERSSARGQYQIGQVIETPDGKRWRVTGGDMNDPDVEEVQ